MRKMKKTVCVLLSLLMIIAMIPATAFAEDQTITMLMFGDENGLAAADESGKKDLNHAAECISQRVNIQDGKTVEKYLYLATYQLNGEMPDMENLIDIEDVPTENAVYIADYPGTDGNDVVGAAIKDMTYSVEGNKITIRYTNGGNDIFAENDFQGYRMNLNVQTDAGSSRYGTLRIAVGEPQGGSSNSPLRIKTNRFTAVPGETLYNGFHNTPITIYMNGEQGEEILNIDDSVEIWLSNTGIGQIAVDSVQNIFSFIPYAPGGSDLNIKVDETQYTFRMEVEEGDLGGGNEPPEIAPVDPNAPYALTLEMLQDPDSLNPNGYEIDTSRMRAIGQGSVLQFNSRITAWETCFFVRNQNTGYDARYVVKPNSRENRTYIGALEDFELQIRKRGTAVWTPASEVDQGLQVFTLRSVGEKKGYGPIFCVEYDEAKDTVYKAAIGNKVTEDYAFRLHYIGTDPYLCSGNERNSVDIELERDDSMVDFDLDFYFWDEHANRYATGNVLHFDYIDTGIAAKLNLRPGVMKSVADKTVYGKNDYLFIEDDAANFKFYYETTDETGRYQKKPLTQAESPFTVTWDGVNERYNIVYDKPQNDIHGPFYAVSYEGDYETVIREKYGDGTYNVENLSELITRKITMNVTTVPENGNIDATTDADVNTTEVIFENDAIADQEEIRVATNDGTVTLGGTLVDSMQAAEQNVSLQMCDVKEEGYYVTAQQQGAVDEADMAFDFKVTEGNADVSFGENGYAVVSVPCNLTDVQVFYLDENGQKTPVACTCENGVLTFQTSHFSTYLVEGEKAQRLAVLWNDELLYGRNNDNNPVIQIPECCGESLRIYFDGEPNEDTWAFGESDNEDICYAGVSPDNALFEVYLNANAKAGDACDVTLYFGNQQNPISATYRLEVVPGVRLQREDQSLVYPNGSLGGSQEMTVQLTMGDQRITDGYTVGTNGNTVLQAIDMGNGVVKLIPVGNGSVDLIVQYDGRKFCYQWTTEGLSDEAAVSNVAISLDSGKTILPGNTIRMDGGSTVSGSVSLNGQPLTAYDVRIERRPDRCSVTANSDGTFTLTSLHVDGYCSLVLSYEKDGIPYEAVFEVQVQEPTAYILQFYHMEKQSDGSFIHNGGFATLGIFQKAQQDKYTKFIVTDQYMRRVGVEEDHFVNVTPDTLAVVVYDKEIENYVEVPDDENPFTITADANAPNMLQIHYDRSKDKHGPAYMLVYTAYAQDPYLGIKSEEFEVDNTIFLWTRSVADFVKWHNLSREDNHWVYDATVDTYEGFEKTDSDCDVKQAAVEIPQSLFGEEAEQISVSEDTTLEILTDIGDVTMDAKVLGLIREREQDVTLKILDVDPEDAEYQEVASALANASCIVDLKLNSGTEAIHDFGTGTATVKLHYHLSEDAAADGKVPYVYYVDAEGNKQLIPCEYDAENGILLFETSHFSLFEVEEDVVQTEPDPDPKPEIPSGGGIYLPSLQKPVISAGSGAAAQLQENGTKAVITVEDGYELVDVKVNGVSKGAVTELIGLKTGDQVEIITKQADKEAEASLEEIRESLKAINAENFFARSAIVKMRSGRKAVKITWNTSADITFDGVEIFRSTKRFEGYTKKPVFSTEKDAYYNTAIESETRYYYKVRGYVDVDGIRVYTGWSRKAWRTV